MTSHMFDDPAVAAAFEALPASRRHRLLAVRDLAFDIAARTPAIGALAESLKWGEPAYRPVRARTGTTVRLGITPSAPDACAVLVNCKTSLLATFRDLYPDSFGFEGARALILDPARPLPIDELSHCLSLALTYHARGRRPDA